MAESGGLFILDGEDAGSTPWEFDSVATGSGNTFALDATAKNNGDYGYKAAFGGTEDGTHGLKTFTTEIDFYVRFYIYLSSNFALGRNYALLPIFSLYDGATMLCRIMLHDSGGNATADMWHIRGQTLTNTQTNTNFSFTTWHYIEVRWIKNASTGGAQVWVDGDIILNELDGDTSAFDVDRIFVGDDNSQGETPDSGEFYYLDDVKADTSYIGAYAGAAAAPTSIFDGPLMGCLSGPIQ